ncbi:phage tail protein [Puniceibacterium sp. IMCC21224]|uniref:phage tail protein n=1 Tax=Puniceibacterium sp. IMCC21224 TaxID=1618204 RepID=UPI00065CFB31|nr:tail fiber protein [Puniceibacterium sp. IMCC21224]KMK67682.1 phage tail collar family protein [Puniceibacterium sp. IMCC21224]
MTLYSTIHKSVTAAVAATTMLTAGPGPALAGSYPFLGEIAVYAFNYCPQGWAKADGQLLAVSSYDALFSLYGTIYGGDGRTTFGLPDLRGRTPLNRGQGPGLSDYRQGTRGGTETTTLTIQTMPAHNHMVNATNADGTKGGPGTDYLAVARKPGSNDHISVYSEGPPNKQMDPAMIEFSGSGYSFESRAPYLAMTTCISLFGIYPSRS